MAKTITGLQRNLDVAWAAGLLDGEGCIGFINKGNGYWQLRCQMGSHEAILRLQSIFGGTVNPQQKPPPRGLYWMWYCRAANQVAVLRELLPFLVVKRVRAEEALHSMDRKAFLRDPRAAIVKKVRGDLAQAAKDKAVKKAKPAPAVEAQS